MTRNNSIRYQSTIGYAGLMAGVFVLSAAFLLWSTTARADLPPETVLTGNQVQDSFSNDDDAVVGPYDIGFAFKYFGNTYTQFYISSNGYIGFNSTGMSTFSNPGIPTASAPNDIICAFFDDTYIYGSTKVFYATVGTEPNRKLVVEYYNLGFFATTLPLGTFQIILYEGSNKIQFQYRILIGTGRPEGSSATVGLENSDGSAGVQYSYNTASLTSEWVIAFLPDDADNPTDYTVVDKNSDPDNASYEGILLVSDANNSPASIPQLSCPGNGVTDGTGPLFQWGAADEADDYTIKVDDNPDMGSPAILETDLANTEYNAANGTLTSGTTYYWMIHAFNAIGDETWSQKWTLTAQEGATAPPGQSLLVEPDEGATDLGLSVTFDWQETCGGDSYTLAVSTNNDMSDPVAEVSGLADTTDRVTGLTAGTRYYWRVTAHNDGGDTNSAVRTFTTAADAQETTYGLTVDKIGQGSGRVTSDPAGINCGSDCSETYNEGETVVLSAAPAAGSVFQGWSGDCSGTGDCTLTMDQDNAVTARFGLATVTYNLEIIKEGDGDGRVTSTPSGISCGDDCENNYTENQRVVLQAVPDADSAFDGWDFTGGDALHWINNDCRGNGDCILTMDQVYRVRATFSLDEDVDGVGSTLENAGPNGGDGNNDGQPDSMQNHVATFTDIDGNWVTMAVEDSLTIRNVNCTTNPGDDDPPAGYEYPRGFFGFEVQGVEPGATSVMTLIFHTPDSTIASYFKYGPTVDDNTPHWYEFLYDGETGAVITAEGNTTVIRLHLRDGADGDDDLTENGVIVDIGAPVIDTGIETGTASGDKGGCFTDSLLE